MVVAQRLDTIKHDIYLEGFYLKRNLEFYTHRLSIGDLIYLIMASPSEILFFAPNLIGYLRVFVYILAGGAAMEVDPFGWFLTDEAPTCVKQPISHHPVQRHAASPIADRVTQKWAFL